MPTTGSRVLVLLCALSAAAAAEAAPPQAAAAPVPAPRPEEMPGPTEAPGPAEAPVPGPLTGTLPPVTVSQPARPALTRPPTPPITRTIAPAALPRTFVGALKPGGPGEKATGRIVADPTTHDLKILDLSVTEAPGLEVLLVAADAVPTAEALLGAKHLSLGRIKRIRPQLAFRLPAELDLEVYRTLVVWSRRDRTPRAVARLLRGRAD